jgi:hypothetical protein
LRSTEAVIEMLVHDLASALRLAGAASPSVLNPYVASSDPV